MASQPAATTAELIKEMRGVKGVGPYAAENLLKLLGRYDGLALDSWTRAKFFTVRNNGRKAQLTKRLPVTTHALMNGAAWCCGAI